MKVPNQPGYWIVYVSYYEGREVVLVHDDLKTMSTIGYDLWTDIPNKSFEFIEPLDIGRGKPKAVPPLSEGEMPWCDSCQSYHHGDCEDEIRTYF